MEKKGLLIVVSGPSGAGKGTVLAHTTEKYSNLRYSVSVTTRAPREGEVDGVNYFFKTVEQFEKMVVNGEFLEHKKVHDNYYGTPIANVQKYLSDGYDVVLERYRRRIGRQECISRRRYDFHHSCQELHNRREIERQSYRE